MANTYKALSTVTVGAGGAASISFTNIPQTYTDLVIQVSGRDNRTNLTDDFGIQINGSTSTFSYRAVVGSGSSVSANSNTFSVAGIWNGNTSTSSIFGNATIYIPNYTSSNPKAITSDSVMENNGAYSELWLTGTLWNTSTPITSITIVGNNVGSTILQHSTATLYGVFNADVSTAPATPTIGTATAGASSASITFTPVSNAASYTMTSTPSSITGTGTTSPITVSGLTNGTAYTFKVKSNNPFGSSAESAASNSVTPAIGASYDSISTVTLGSSSSNINITSIPSTYTHLQLRGQYSFTNNGGTPRFRLGTGGSVDSGTKYNWNEFFANSSGVSSWTGYNNDTSYIGYGGEITSQCAFVLDIFDYANSNKRKSYKWTIMAGVGAVYYGVGFFDATAAITNINMFGQVGSFQTGSKFALYGIKG
jgi:hypothetical protein